MNQNQKRRILKYIIYSGVVIVLIGFIVYFSILKKIKNVEANDGTSTLVDDTISINQTEESNLKEEESKISDISNQEQESHNYEHIIITYPTMSSSRTEGIEEVVNAVNEISKEKIGVEIELKIVDILSTIEDYPYWITQGIQMDLMVLNYQDITNYVDQQMVLPLNSLLEEYGKDIQSISQEQGDLFSGARFYEQIYGVSIPADTKGSCGGLWIPESYLKEISFEYDENHIYTLEELDNLFGELKKLHPDQYPLGANVTIFDFSISLFFMQGFYDDLGSSKMSGVLSFNEEYPTLINYYETSEYYDWLTYMRKWYLEGYIYPDAAINTNLDVEMVEAGITMSFPQGGQPSLFEDTLKSEKMVCLRLTPVRYTMSGKTGTFWTIPETCKNPDAAMKFLNLMYTDEEVINLFSWGIEGRDYEFIEEGVITFPEGKDSTTVEYYNSLGLYGNPQDKYFLNSSALKERLKEFSEQAVSLGFEYSGFYFDITKVAIEKKQVQKVLDFYLDILETGSVDLDTIYPQFIKELENAGIDILIAEKQKQLDLWLLNQGESDF